MKKMKWSAIMVPLAVAGFFLRRLVYTAAVDWKNLIVAGHPAVVALWALTAAALALAAFAGWKQEKEMSFESRPAAFLGHGLLGVAAAMTVLLNYAPMSGLLGQLWKLFGIAAPVCLLPAGFDRMRGKKPFFALYIAPCLFFGVHVVVHYQLWCSNPQFTDYAFALLASVALTLYCYQLTACSVDMSDRRMLVMTSLAAVYLCSAELAAGGYPYLYLAGVLFCLTNRND